MFSAKWILVAEMILGLTVALHAKAGNEININGYEYNLSNIGITLNNYPIDGVEIGQGWDSISGRKVQGTCVLGTTKPIVNNSSTIDYQYILDKEQLYRALSISASGKFSGAVMKGSASSTFVENSKIEKSRTYILGTVTAEKGGLTIYPIIDKENPKSITLNLSPAALNSAKRNVQEFTKMCGDSFVTSIRVGGRLDVLFENIEKDDEFNQIFSASAKAKGFGGSGKVSMNKSKSEKLSTATQSLRMVQIGGSQKFNLLTQNNSDAVKAVFTKISEFGDLASAESVPYLVITIPYSALSNWPKVDTLKHSSPQEIMDLKGLYERYSDLAELYSTAAISPSDYYNPFLKDEQELIYRADIIKAASSCLEGVVAYCIKNSDCSINELLASEKVNETCKMAFSGLPQNSANADESIQHPKNAALTLVREGNLISKEVDKNIYKYNFSKLNDTNNVFGKSDANGVFPREWLYYELLARAPLIKSIKKIETPNVLNNDDEFNSIVKYCAVLKGQNNCKEVDYSNMQESFNTEDQLDKAAIDVIRKWLLTTRLFPLSASFCEQSDKHPMCFSIANLYSIVMGVGVDVGPLHGFMKMSPVPADTPKPRPPKVERIPPDIGCRSPRC